MNKYTYLLITWIYCNIYVLTQTCSDYNLECYMWHTTQCVSRDMAKAQAAAYSFVVYTGMIQIYR